jgi:NDP-sugar pyrophosphorylase family protein
MPVGDRAILEHVIEQLNRFGFTDITLSVGYLSHLIQAVFDHGSRHNARITYVHEEEPLGTAGPLRLIDGLDETFLVLNGDVLTTLDFGEVVRHHRASGALLTIATHKRKTKIDYGILHVDAESDQPLLRISAYDEKPELDWLVSMGVYVMEPGVRDFIPERRAFDFPELVQALLRANEPVGAFLFEGLWLDIGRHEDYERATTLLETNPTVLYENDMELK